MSLWSGLEGSGGKSMQNYGSIEPRQGSATSSPARRIDPSQRYHQLCDSISSCIFSVNNSVAALEQAVKQLGTQADTPAFRDKIHLTQQTANETIKTTTDYIRELTSMIREDDKQQRLQSQRFKNEFQETVKRYSHLQKQVAMKQKYTYTLVSQKSTSGKGIWGSEEDADEDKALVSDDGALQQQQQLDADLEYEQALLAERDTRIRQIESDMLDCNQVFRDLATLVHEQGAVIDTIEANVEDTQYNTQRAAEQLNQASQYQKKYRKKLCCLIIIFVIIAIVLFLVIYFGIKK